MARALSQRARRSFCNKKCFNILIVKCFLKNIFPKKCLGIQSFVAQLKFHRFLYSFSQWKYISSIFIASAALRLDHLDIIALGNHNHVFFQLARRLFSLLNEFSRFGSKSPKKITQSRSIVGEKISWHLRKLLAQTNSDRYGLLKVFSRLDESSCCTTVFVKNLPPAV